MSLVWRQSLEAGGEVPCGHMELLVERRLPNTGGCSDALYGQALALECFRVCALLSCGEPAVHPADAA
jgi:hypothetical protein